MTIWKAATRMARHSPSRPRQSSESDTQYFRQPSPAESYMNRRHPESVYESSTQPDTPSLRSRKTKALELLREFRDQEEERLAELQGANPGQNVAELDYQDKPNSHSFSAQRDPIDMIAPRGRESIYRGNGRLRAYNKTHARAASEDLIELDTERSEQSPPELPGSEAQNPYSAGQRGNPAPYGDKRFNTLAGEPIPLFSRPRAPSPANSPGVAVTPSVSGTSSKDMKFGAEDSNDPRRVTIKPDINPRSGLPLAPR